MTEPAFPHSPAELRRALESYESVIEAQGVSKLPERDRWYREELPRAIRSRSTPHVTLPEIGRAHV